MASCENCNNILPLTVDQCPVCGMRTARPQETISSSESRPGWAPGPDRGLSADEFLNELLDRHPEPPPVTQPTEAHDPFSFFVEPASSTQQLTDPFSLPQPPLVSPVPEPPSGTVAPQPAQAVRPHQPPQVVQPPPPPAEPGEPIDALDPMIFGADDPDHVTDRPRRTGHDGATPASPTGHSPIPEMVSDVKIDQVPARSVAAFSNRIQADIKFGIGPRHHLITYGLLIGALAVLTFGVGIAFELKSFADQTLAANQTEIVAEPLAFDDTDLALFADEAESKLVTVSVQECGVTAGVPGFLTGPQTVLVKRSAVTTDTTPVIRMADGTVVPGQVLGWSIVDDIAVINLAQPAEGPVFEWSAANQAPLGTGLVALDLSRPTGGASVVTVTDLGRNRSTGLIETLQLEPSPPAGSIILDLNGRIVAIVGGSEAATADAIRPAIGRILAAPDYPASNCPVVEEPVAEGE